MVTFAYKSIEVLTLNCCLKAMVMKKRIFLLSTGLLFTMSLLIAQDVPVEVVTAFNKGNSQELNKYFAEQVELIIQSSQQNADKGLTESTLSSFFNDHKVNGFTVNHKGNRSESSFMIGTLATAKGRFRVNCFFRKLQNNYIIHQIRIDKINE